MKIILRAYCFLWWLLFLGLPLTSFAGQKMTFNPQFFGIHSFYAAAKLRWPDAENTVIPEIFGSWRLWNALGTEWLEIEPKRNEWDFRYLDRYVEIAKPKGIDLLLTLGMTPQWAAARPGEKSGAGFGAASPPADIAEWRRYVKMVATRYRGKISAYEIWNEPALTETDKLINSRGEAGFFSGSADQLVDLARAAYEEIKEADPKALVVSPSFVGQKQGIRRLAEYLKHGGCAYADVIGFHFYQVESVHPEDIVGLIRGVKDTLAKAGCSDKPIWNTESGLIIQGPGKPVAPLEPSGRGVLSVVQSDVQAADYMIRYFLIVRSEGVERYYWFALDSGSMGLASMSSDKKTRTLNAAGKGYAMAVRRLSGRTVSGCESNFGIWICAVEGNGGDGWIIWNAFEQPITVDAKPGWIGLPCINMVGVRNIVSQRLTVSGSPIFIGKFPE